MLEDVLRKWGGVEVAPMTVYADVFSLGQNLIQKDGEPKGQYKANPIAYWKNANQSKGHYRILFDDTFEATLKELQEADFAILNGITYFGRKNVQEHASKMYCMIFDLDGVTDKTLNAFLNGAFIVDAYPVPNYVALSGHGVHLYYVFEEPVPLYPNIKMQLKALKYALIEKIWNEYTSMDEKKQFQGINQGFRPIGGKTKIDGVRVRAFRINQHPFTLNQLGKYIPEENRVDETKLFKESKMSLEEAKKKYQKWYEKRIENQEPKGYWKCKSDLYEWWIRKIKEGATYHHRYFNIMCLAIYGVKSGIEYEQVKVDAMELLPFMNAINPDEPFTEDDVMSALECYDERYCTFPIDDIIKISGIMIEKNKRNYRRQVDHVKLMNFIREEINGNKNWRNTEGRPTAKQTVMDWQIIHPDGKKADCIRDTGLSKKTVYKWWDFKEEK
jgi:hypothetical protein